MRKLEAGVLEALDEGAFEVATVSLRIGLPGKSGVGGGVLTIAPNRGSIAVWSPGLNDAGTSTVSALALEALVQRTGWSVFG